MDIYIWRYLFIPVLIALILLLRFTNPQGASKLHTRLGEYKQALGLVRRLRTR